jgi:hypothetical protein
MHMFHHSGVMVFTPRHCAPRHCAPRHCAPAMSTKGFPTPMHYPNLPYTAAIANNEQFPALALTKK